MNIIDNGDCIIGYLPEVFTYVRKKLQELLEDYEDDYIYGIKDMTELLVALYEGDYNLIKITECAMGGFTITELEG